VIHCNAGDRALRQILEDAMRIADRCVNPDDRDSITKTVSNVESMLDALCELRQQGKVDAVLSLFSLLACSAKLPTGLYILPSVISFFYYLFNDFLENNYLRIRWIDFRNLFTE